MGTLGLTGRSEPEADFDGRETGLISGGKRLGARGSGAAEPKWTSLPTSALAGCGTDARSAVVRTSTGPGAAGPACKGMVRAGSAASSGKDRPAGWGVVDSGCDALVVVISTGRTFGPILAGGEAAGSVNCRVGGFGGTVPDVWTTAGVDARAGVPTVELAGRSCGKVWVGTCSSIV